MALEVLQKSNVDENYLEWSHWLFGYNLIFYCVERDRLWYTIHLSDNFSFQAEQLIVQVGSSRPTADQIRSKLLSKLSKDSQL